MNEQTQSTSTQIADSLERLAIKIRESTVDRAAKAITIISIGFLLAVTVIIAVVWLLMGIIQALRLLIGTETAYFVIGLFLLLSGAFIWSRRYSRNRPTQ